jgi:hypothetical protein
MKIITYDQLLQLAEESLFEKEQFRDFEISDSLNYTVKIFGNSWDGTIDCRIAKYILEVQKQIDNLYDELGIEIDKDQRVLVKFTINEGCTEAVVEIAKTLREIFTNMESSHKLYLATVLSLSIVGAFTVWQFKEYKSEQIKLKHDLEQSQLVSDKELKQQQQLIDIIGTISEKIPNYSSPNKVLAVSMREGDEIKLSTQQVKFTKDDFKKQYPGKSKFKPESVYIDGKYLITAIILESGKIIIDHQGEKYDCLSSLNEAESNELFSQVKAAHAAKKGFKLDMKITAKYYKGTNEIRDLIIYEIGPPRNGAKTIESLIKK